MNPETARLTVRARLVAYLQQSGLSTARAEANIDALLAEERAAPPVVSSSGRAALLHETALSATERQFLTFALDLAADEMASRGDEFGAEDEAALDLLRRMAAEEQPAETQDGSRDAIIADLLPAWEAVYEPGNVSDYLIGYANDQDAATGAAEAWMRSKAEVTGRLEWEPWGTATPLPDGYDAWFELVERHDDGIDTGPGIIVRHRIEPVVGEQPDTQETRHVGGNAEDCPACQERGFDMLSHPWTCPGPAAP
ncbi:hypothetical protein [Streptomyces antibioticus]|nr:hypothetical protein [Streptomyces antibioticus]QIT47605.1 hypothetical protein HCX60_32120 [Streptomyces antibioticus]